MPPDERFMRMALMLAERGRGFVEPNPMVGAVVLNAVGELVGQGYHERFGQAHAEVNAFAQAKELAHGGTLYVTLEPCCHVGKTPPCTEAVLRSGVRRVVIAMADPFPKVAGGGVKLLQEAGLQVEVGLLEAEARQLNAPYLKLVQHQKPWVIAKWAMTLDGKIATKTGDSQWISGEASRAKVQELRGRVDAILVGAGTLRRDNPLLTARPPGPRTATRIVISSSGDLPASCQLLNTIAQAPVLVFTTLQNVEKLHHWKQAGAEVIGLASGDSELSLNLILEELGQRRFTNIMLEGGGKLLGSFHDERAIDEAWIFVGPKLFGGDQAASPVGGQGIERLNQALQAASVEVQQLGPDAWIRAIFPNH